MLLSVSVSHWTVTNATLSVVEVEEFSFSTDDITVELLMGMEL